MSEVCSEAQAVQTQGLLHDNTRVRVNGGLFFFEYTYP